jgi:hypothetical protein
MVTGRPELQALELVKKSGFESRVRDRIDQLRENADAATQ